MISKIENTEKVTRLFSGWNETIIWSCLQGIMGEVYTDEKYKSAIAVLGDFCFFAGMPDDEFIKYKPNSYDRNFVIMVPQNEEWSKLIEDCYSNRASKIERYAFKKDMNNFNIDSLKEATLSLDSIYEIRSIDENIYNLCKKEEWSRDLVSNFRSFECYKKYGMGTVIIKGGDIVCGASSYSVYRGGIEIEIDTREDFRRKRLAYICGAKLIIECLKKGIFPSWDAHNTASAKLAEKLGYCPDYKYTAYEIWDY